MHFVDSNGTNRWGAGMIDREKVMKSWDKWRAAIAAGDTSSAPRDEFEALLDTYDERIATLESRLELVSENEEGNVMRVDVGDNDGIGCRDETIRLLDARIKKLESWKIGWVKCSERLPTKKEGEYFCVIQGRILDEVHTDFCIGGLSDSGDLLPTEPVAPQWKIIAWLENVPEFVP